MNIVIFTSSHHQHHLLGFIEASLGTASFDLQNPVDCGERARREPLVVQLVPADNDHGDNDYDVGDDNVGDVDYDVNDDDDLVALANMI